MFDDLRMIIDLNESKIRALDQVRAILDDTHTLDSLRAASADERREWVASVLRRFRYYQRRRAHRGLVLRYVRRFGGFSRAQDPPHAGLRKRPVSRSTPRLAREMSI